MYSNGGWSHWATESASSQQPQQQQQQQSVQPRTPYRSPNASVYAGVGSHAEYGGHGDYLRYTFDGYKKSPQQLLQHQQSPPPSSPSPAPQSYYSYDYGSSGSTSPPIDDSRYPRGVSGRAYVAPSHRTSSSYISRGGASAGGRPKQPSGRSYTNIVHAPPQYGSHAKYSAPAPVPVPASSKPVEKSVALAVTAAPTTATVARNHVNDVVVSQAAAPTTPDTGDVDAARRASSSFAAAVPTSTVVTAAPPGSSAQRLSNIEQMRKADEARRAARMAAGALEILSSSSSSSSYSPVSSPRESAVIDAPATASRTKPPQSTDNPFVAMMERAAPSPAVASSTTSPSEGVPTVAATGTVLPPPPPSTSKAPLVSPSRNRVLMEEMPDLDSSPTAERSAPSLREGSVLSASSDSIELPAGEPEDARSRHSYGESTESDSEEEEEGHTLRPSAGVLESRKSRLHMPASNRPPKETPERSRALVNHLVQFIVSGVVDSKREDGNTIKHRRKPYWKQLQVVQFLLARRVLLTRSMIEVKALVAAVPMMDGALFTPIETEAIPELLLERVRYHTETPVRPATTTTAAMEVDEQPVEEPAPRAVAKKSKTHHRPPLSAPATVNKRQPLIESRLFHLSDDEDEVLRPESSPPLSKSRKINERSTPSSSHATRAHDTRGLRPEGGYDSETSEVFEADLVNSIVAVVTDALDDVKRRMLEVLGDKTVAAAVRSAIMARLESV